MEQVEAELGVIDNPKVTLQTIKMPRILCLVDRDGCINYCDSGQYVQDISQFFEIPKSIEALALLNTFTDVAIITNQSRLSNEDFTINEVRRQDFLEISNHISNSVNLVNNGQWDDIVPTFYCPHNKKAFCSCHKPETGLAYMAMGFYGGKIYDEIWGIGDHWTDLMAIKNTGLPNTKTCLLLTGRGGDKDTTDFFLENESPTVTLPDLWSFAQYLGEVRFE